METRWLESDSRSRDSEEEEEEEEENEDEEGGHARWRSSRSHGKKSWTKVRLMVEKCKLSGNPPGGKGRTWGPEAGMRWPLLWVDNGVSPAYQPAKTP